jgi:DNA-nicking Smr family endonuclease
MPRRRLYGETQKRRQKGQTAQLKRSASPHRVESTQAPAGFERSEPLSRQDVEFLEVMREMQVQPNPKRVIPPRRLRETERVRIEDPAEAGHEFLEAMANLGVRPLKGTPPGAGAPGAAAPSSAAVPPGGGNAPSGALGPAMPAPANAAAPETRASSGAQARPPVPGVATTALTPPERVRFEDGMVTMAELLKGQFDPDAKYEGAPPLGPRTGKGPGRTRQIDHDLDPDDQVDLHGKTQEEAIHMVQNFLVAARKRRLRHVLIITGRGLRSGEHGPVLKDAVSRWLERNGERFMREYRPAPGRHGGAGAFWVVMK